MPVTVCGLCRIEGARPKEKQKQERKGFYGVKKLHLYSVFYTVVSYLLLSQCVKLHFV